MVINIALRFILELCALASFAYWGFHISQSMPIKLLLGIGSPLLVIIIWGLFGSPAAPLPLKGFNRILLEMLIFGLAVFALFSSGKTNLGFIFAIIVIINRILLYIWDQ